MSDNINNQAISDEINSLRTSIAEEKKLNRALFGIIDKMLDRLDRCDNEIASAKQTISSLSRKISVNDHILCH